MKRRKGKGTKDKGRRDIFQTKSPIIAASPIHQDKGISKTTHRETVTKGYIDMNCVKVPVTCTVKRFALVAFGDGGKGSKRGREVAPVNPLASTAHLEKMLVVFDFLQSIARCRSLADQRVFLLKELAVSQG